MKSRLFISKDRKEVEELSIFCEKENIELIAISQIKFSFVPFQIQSAFDVIFISSIRAAKFFLQQEKIRENVQIACIGSVTASKLKDIGIQVDFIGEKAGSPKDVAEDFKNWLGNRKVLIPCSDISNRSVAGILQKEQVEEVIVYRTKNDCKTVEESSVYVFTSPSNFKSFLTCNSLSVSAKIIAWGQTTELAIKKTGYEVIHTLSNSDSKELLEFLSKSNLFYHER